MNEVIQNMKERRSVRKYKNEQIREEQLAAILEAGLYAPNGRGMQKTKFVVIQDKEVRDQVAKMNAAVMGSTSDPFYGAPTVIVVLADKTRVTTVEDGSAVMCNLVNAAHSVGVDSCWIHRAKEVFESEEGQKMLREWGIGEEYVGIGNCILGYGDGEYPEAAPRDMERIIRI